MWGALMPQYRGSAATPHRYETTKAADAVAALKASLKPLATVKRDDKWQQIDAALLVPGDMVLLAAGAAVPADCVVSGVGWWRVQSQRPGRSKAGAAALLLAGGAAGAAQRVPSPACACWPSPLWLNPLHTPTPWLGR